MTRLIALALMMSAVGCTSSVALDEGRGTGGSGAGTSGSLSTGSDASSGISGSTGSGGSKGFSPHIIAMRWGDAPVNGGGGSPAGSPDDELIVMTDHGVDCATPFSPVAVTDDKGCPDVFAAQITIPKAQLVVGGMVDLSKYGTFSKSYSDPGGVTDGCQGTSGWLDGTLAIENIDIAAIRFHIDGSSWYETGSYVAELCGATGLCTTDADCASNNFRCHLHTGGCDISPDDSGCGCFCCEIGPYFSAEACTVDSDCLPNHACYVVATAPNGPPQWCLGPLDNNMPANASPGVCGPKKCAADDDCANAYCVMGVCSAERGSCEIP